MRHARFNWYQFTFSTVHSFATAVSCETYLCDKGRCEQITGLNVLVDKVNILTRHAQSKITSKHKSRREQSGSEEIK